MPRLYKTNLEAEEYDGYRRHARLKMSVKNKDRKKKTPMIVIVSSVLNDVGNRRIR